MSTVFRYIARETEGLGRRRSGDLIAATPSEARRALRAMGLSPVRLKERRRAASKSKLAHALIVSWEDYRRSKRGAARAELCDALATMLESEIPLAAGLHVLAEDASAASSARRFAMRLEAGVREGGSFSQAVAAESSWFDASEIAMVGAGELSGELARVLRTIATRAIQGDERRSAIGAALLYPAAVATVGVGVALFLANRTLPQLTTVLESAAVPVPRLTSIVMGVGQFLWQNMLLIAVLLAITTVGVVAAWHLVVDRSPALITSVRRATPRWKTDQVLARWLRQLGDLLDAGVPLVPALESAGSTCRGVLAARLRRDVDDAAARVGRGEDPIDAVQGIRELSPEVRQVMRVGADSGELTPMLRRVADRLDRKADRALVRWSRLIEPAAVIVMAACVGVVVMAAVLPILSLQEIVG